MIYSHCRYQNRQCFMTLSKWQPQLSNYIVAICHMILTMENFYSCDKSRHTYRQCIFNKHIVAYIVAIFWIVEDKLCHRNPSLFILQIIRQYFRQCICNDYIVDHIVAKIVNKIIKKAHFFFFLPIILVFFVFLWCS